MRSGTVAPKQTNHRASALQFVLSTLARDFGIAEPGLETDTDLLGSGLLDSIAVIELVTSIETDFGVRLDDSDVDPEWFHCPAKIAELIEWRRREQSAAAA